MFSIFDNIFNAILLPKANNFFSDIFGWPMSNAMNINDCLCECMGGWEIIFHDAMGTEVQ